MPKYINDTCSIIYNSKLNKKLLHNLLSNYNGIFNNCKLPINITHLTMDDNFNEKINT